MREEPGKPQQAQAQAGQNNASRRDSPRVLTADGTLDLSNIDLVLPDSGDFPGTVQKVTLVEGATTGTFRSVSGLPTGWEIFADAQKLQARKTVGFTVIIR